jgi:hypothetical protein
LRGHPGTPTIHSRRIFTKSEDTVPPSAAASSRPSQITRLHSIDPAPLSAISGSADAYPAAPGVAGYVELWMYAYPYEADDIQPLLHLVGTPALPQASPPQPAPIPRRSRPHAPQIKL